MIDGNKLQGYRQASTIVVGININASFGIFHWKSPQFDWLGIDDPGSWSHIDEFNVNSGFLKLFITYSNFHYSLTIASIILLFTIYYFTIYYLVTIYGLI